MFRLNLWTQNPWGFPPGGYPPPGCFPPPPLPPPAGIPGFPWMEATTTVPSTLASPALMILATTAEAAAVANQEVIPTSLGNFNSQNDTKSSDGIRGLIPPLHPPVTTSYHQNGHQQASLPTFSPPAVRPPHVACPQFVPPSVQQQAIISPIGGGAFKPVSKPENDPGSAFVAVKKQKIEDVDEDGQDNKERKPDEDEQAKGGMEDRPTSVGSRSSEGTNPDDTRTLRSKFNNN